MSWWVQRGHSSWGKMHWGLRMSRGRMQGSAAMPRRRMHHRGHLTGVHGWNMSRRRMMFSHLKFSMEGSLRMLMGPGRRHWQSVVMFVWRVLARRKRVSIMSCGGKGPRWRVFQRRWGQLCSWGYNCWMRMMVTSLSRIFSLCWGGWGDRTAWYPPCSCSSWSLLHFASQRFMIVIVQNGLYVMCQVWRHPHGVAGKYQGWKNWTGLDTWIGNWRVRPQYQIMSAQAPATAKKIQKTVKLLERSKIFHI